MTEPTLDLERLDKGELRCLVEELLGDGCRCTPRAVATARWRAAAARSKRLYEVEEAAMRDYLDAYHREGEALKARGPTTRLTKARMDAEIVWGRTRRAASDAQKIVDRRWDELQATWEVKGAAQ
jgi:hypothetical protein